LIFTNNSFCGHLHERENLDSILPYIAHYDFENIFFCQDRSLNLDAVIAIYDTTLGPATGGCRLGQAYTSKMETIEAALRLARGMTYKKFASTGIYLGGGKAVIIGDPNRKEREPMFRVLGKFIIRLGGLYITGEDVGTTRRFTIWNAMNFIRVLWAKSSVTTN